MVLYSCGQRTRIHAAHPAMTTWTYIGRQGKAYLVTDGIRTKHLTAREFRTFAWS